MALFRSKEAETIETVQAKLAAAEQEVQAAERRLHEVSLEAALGDNEDAGHDATAQLRQARDKAELLRHALQVADEKERDRLAAAASAAEKSRIRALRQHLAALQKAAAEYEQATAAQMAVWVELLQHAEKACKLLKGTEGIALSFAGNALRRLGALELQRQAFPAHPLQMAHQIPGVPTPMIFDPAIPSLTATLAQLSEGLIAETGGTANV
jgi:hypothetical protein